MPFDPLNPGQMGNSSKPGVKKSAERPAASAAPRRKPSGAEKKPAASRPQAEPAHHTAASPRPQAGAAAHPRAQTGAAPHPQTRSPASRSAGTSQRPHPAGTAHPAARRRPAGGKHENQERTGMAAPGYRPKFSSSQKKTVNIPPVLKKNPKMTALISLLVLGCLVMVILSVKMVTGPHEPPQYQEIPEIPALETLPPVIPHVVGEATISVTGDLLPHKTIYSKGSVIYKDEQDYDFSPIFKFLGGYTDTADYAIANLETSLYGPEKAYSGNPNFNTPDQIVDGAKNAGFDMLLTANNHCNDTGIKGVLRTVQVIRDKGLKALGTNLASSEQKYHIQDLNGIRVGMLCYTYEDSQNPGQVTFNYNALPKDSSDLVCSFPKFTNAKSRDPFYEEVGRQIGEMRGKGADMIVIFLHWGEEYHLKPSEDQQAMAQKLCDLGADVIVGGHPHVVEPVELLTDSQNPDHRTVCLYSLGNAFSNQRREEMTSQKSGHTEDGMLFNMTFQKYSDNSVYLSKVDVIPTWVNKHADPEGKREYNILPLDIDRKDQWQTLFGIDENTAAKAAESYGRTMDLVGAGLEASNAWLSSRLPGEPEPTETSLPTAS